MDQRDWIQQQFGRHSEALYRYVRSFRVAEDEAYDIVQAAFLKLLEQKPRSVRQPKAWLYTVARNLTINMLGRRKPQADIESDEMPSRLPDSLEKLLENENHATLWGAFEQLSKDEREMMRLHLVDEMSLTEIAAVMNRSVGATKVAMHRGRKRLREILEKEENRSRLAG